MSPQRIIGIVCLLVGIALFIVGMNASHSVGDQVSNTFTGKFTDETAWYIFGGAALGIVGILMTVFGVRGHDA